MVDSLFPSIENGENSSPPRRKKLRTSETADAEIESRRINENSLKRWKTNRVQQIYTRKLIEALHRVRQRSNDAAVAAREIRETADRVLAASARGTTRWSRAIVRAKLKKHKKSKLIGNRKPNKSPVIRLPAVERKLKILGRLVPGCRKVSVPNLLDEATDYISALEMQVRTMEALAELLASTTAPRRP